MGPTTAMEVYDAIFKIWEIYYRRGIITAGFLGFSIGVLVCMLFSINGLLRTKKKKDDK